MSPLFGSTLVTALAQSSFTTTSGLSIPGVLARIFHELEDKGLDIEGIFRKSGSNAALNQLQAQFEETTNPFLIKFPFTVSSHTLAGLFKRYLQQLPEPVIPRQYQSTFLDIFDEERSTKETLKRRLKEACKSLPHEHLHLLQFLMEVADMVQQKQDANQMSIEALAIIFAPTCVRIDGVSKLMPSAYTTPICPSYTSLPVTLNKQQLFRKASKMLWNTIRSKKRLSYHDSSTLLYKPNELLQLELVKESNTWIKIFKFMMTYPEVFTTLTNPLKGQKYKHKPSIKTIPTKPKQEWSNTFTQQEKKMLIDFKALEFAESHDLLKKFGSFELNFDHDLKPQNNKRPSPTTASTNTPSKYVETLLNWKSREEENPHVIIPIVKTSTSPQPSDWLRAL
ncbi:Rho GTPase activation protein [Thamnidium elegans]|nr:Rho GTPase activation protein [Thamnidium elegans]